VIVTRASPLRGRSGLGPARRRDGRLSRLHQVRPTQASVIGLREHQQAGPVFNGSHQSFKSGDYSLQKSSAKATSKYMEARTSSLLSLTFVPPSRLNIITTAIDGPAVAHESCDSTLRSRLIGRRRPSATRNSLAPANTLVKDIYLNLLFLLYRISS
jgi:hypothetical protein